MTDLNTIKTAYDLNSKEVVMLMKSDYGWQVHYWKPDGVAPPTDYDTPHEAAARVLQLINITEPIVPQNWPEKIEITRID